MNSPGFGMAARIEASCEASCLQVVQNGDNSVSVKILQVHISSYIFSSRYRKFQSNYFDSVYNAQFTRPQAVLYQSMSLTKMKLLYILQLSLDPRNQSNYLIHSYIHCIRSGMARTPCQQWLLDQQVGKVEAASLLPLLRTAASQDREWTVRVVKFCLFRGDLWFLSDGTRNRVGCGLLMVGRPSAK